MYVLPVRAILEGDLVRHRGEVVKVFTWKNSIELVFEDGGRFDAVPDLMVKLDDVQVNLTDSDIAAIFKSQQPKGTE